MAAQSKGEKPHDLQCLTIHELEQHAHQRMDKQTRDYYNEGADSGSTLLENSTAFSKYRIRPRVLRDISLIDTTTTCFGRKVALPVGVAPTAMQCLAHPDGELATARASVEAGVPMGLSSFATQTLEDVAEAMASAAGGVQRRPPPPRALQLYLFEEREHSRKLIRRAKRAGYTAVFLTVDTPMLGRRNLEIRNQFRLPKVYRVANFVEGEDDEEEEENEKDEADEGLRDGDAAGTGTSGGGEMRPRANEAKKRSGSTKSSSENEKKKEASVKGYHDGEKRVPPKGPITFHTHAANPTLCWERDIEWLKRECGPEMQVWIKGVATGEDAILAVYHGVDGIIVSNHGGRQLNGALATLDALPDIVKAVQGKIPVHVDGGIRHGTDVFKALALGANFVWVGRPVLWGLAYKGQEGAELCLRLLSDEFRLCMGLAGTVRVDDITTDYLVKIDKGGFVSRL